MAWCAAFAASVAGCTADPRAGGDLSTSESPIIRGVIDDARNDAVVMLVHQLGPTSGTRCTATLIARDVIATARHCVSTQTSPGVLGDDFDPASLFVHLGVTPRATADAGVRRIVHDGSRSLADHDFALLVLDRAIGGSIAALRLATPPRDGERVLAIGYGTTELDDAPSEATHVRYRRDGLEILLVGPSTENDLGARELVIGESTCQGDSGGPLMDASSRALVAVSARGGNGAPTTPTEPWAPCVAPVYNLFTRIDAFDALIRSTLAEVGAVPIEETQQPDAHVSGGGCSMARSPRSLADDWALALAAILALAPRRRARTSARVIVFSIAWLACMASVALGVACKRVDEPEPSKESPRSTSSASSEPEPAKLVVEDGKLKIKGGFSAEPFGTPGPQVKISDDRMGTGPIVTEGNTVKVRYSCKLESGEVVDASAGEEPFTFTLGKGTVMEGWGTGIPGMKVGGKRTLNIPPNRAYGAAGKPPKIPPNARLFCEIELVGLVG